MPSEHKPEYEPERNPVLHDANCTKCTRLVQLRDMWQRNRPHWHNAPVDSFGGLDAATLIIGLAPGRLGANRTGRPFTGDAAGRVLFERLIAHGLAKGRYDDDGKDNIRLEDVRITNAVRCLPPDNHPLIREVKNCAAYLRAEMAAMPRLSTMLTLGRVAHNATLRCAGLRPVDAPFAHGAVARVAVAGREVRLVSSYHCSRYNMNTRRLTPEMLDAVFALIAGRGRTEGGPPRS